MSKSGPFSSSDVLEDMAEPFKVAVKVFGIYVEGTVHESDLKGVFMAFKCGYREALLPGNKVIGDLVYSQDACGQ